MISPRWMILATLVGSSAMAAITNLRPYKEVELKNGLKVLLVSDSSLPYFSLSLALKTGATVDSSLQPGLSSIVAQLLEKGTKTRSAQKLADALGTIGADFDASVSQDTTYLSSSTLANHADELLSLFAEIITSPKFEDSEIERVKKERIAQIQQLVDNPSSFANRAFDQFLFGDNPYGVPTYGTIASVSQINRTAVIKSYFQNYRPSNAILSVTGQFGDDIVPRLEKAFEGWAKKITPPQTLSAARDSEKLRIRLVHKADLTQAYIRLGHLGIRRQTPDYMTVRTANLILGAGFTSRLMDEIRDNLGLTYGISSEFDARKVEGPFSISTFTRNEKVGEVVQKTLEIVKKFRDSGATDEEVSSAKGYLGGVFPKALETAEGLSGNLLSLRLHGVSDEYLTKFYDNLEAVGKSEINAAAKKYLRPEAMTILIFANKDAVQSQLEKIGPVEVVDYKTLQ